MDKIVIINGSHRAPLSNSRRFSKVLMKFLKTKSEEFLLNKTNYDEISKELFASTKGVLVFPLYMDCIPSILLGFLNRLEKLGEKYKERPTIYVMINCGFIDSEHTRVAMDIMKYYLKKNGFAFGGALSIGTGESILDSPFRSVATRKIKEFAWAVDQGEPCAMKTQMPVPKGIFVRVSNRFWVLKGAANKVSNVEMQIMEIK